MVSAVNAACLNYRPQLQPLPEDAGRIPLVTAWESTAGRGTYGTIALRDSVFYVGDADRRVYAVDLGTGRARWSKRLPGSVFGGIQRSGDTLYTATDRPNSRVMALHAHDGRRLWERDIGKLSAPIALIDDRILAPTQAGRLYSLDAATGAVQWERRLGQARSAAILAAPDTVILATIDTIVSLTARDGKVLDKIPSPGAITGGWAHAGVYLIAGTTDSLVIALDAGAMHLAWRVKLDAAVLARPTVTGDTAFVVSRIGTLYRIPLTPPSPHPVVVAALEWPVTTSPVRFREWILVGGADGVIRAIAPSGREEWRLGLWQPIRVPPIVLADGLLAIGGIGDFHRYRQE